MIKSKKLSLTDEKILQVEIYNLLEAHFGISVEREKRLDAGNIIDFFILGIGIEVKIKGQKRAIYKQCERYCGFPEIEALVLVTNVSMGFPEEINGKSCYVVKLSHAWL